MEHLSSSVSPATIRAANEAIKESVLTPPSKLRGAYAKYTPTQQAKIGEYMPQYMATWLLFTVSPFFKAIIDTSTGPLVTEARLHGVRGVVNSGHAKHENKKLENFFWREMETFAKIWISRHTV